MAGLGNPSVHRSRRLSSSIPAIPRGVFRLIRKDAGREVGTRSAEDEMQVIFNDDLNVDNHCDDGDCTAAAHPKQLMVISKDGRGGALRCVLHLFFCRRLL